MWLGIKRDFKCEIKIAVGNIGHKTESLYLSQALHVIVYLIFMKGFKILNKKFDRHKIRKLKKCFFHF